jgi:hypothetical protein
MRVTNHKITEKLPRNEREFNVIGKLEFEIDKNYISHGYKILINRKTRELSLGVPFLINITLLKSFKEPSTKDLIEIYAELEDIVNLHFPINRRRQYV